MRLTFIVLLIVGALIVVAAVVAGPRMREGFASFRATPQGTKVRMQTVANGKLVETVKAPGVIEPRTKVEISAEVAARVEQLPFREGEEVRKGDMIVKLDDRDFRAALASAHARSEGEQYRLQSEKTRLTGLLNSLSYAKKQLERKQALYDSGDLPRKELDDGLERVEDIETQIETAKYSISVIESSLSAAKADIARAEDSLSKTVILAPMDGLITALNAEIGEVVLMGTMNNPGTVIMTIADLSRMLLNAEVSESDISRVQVGQRARVHINAYRDEEFTGTVTQIALQRTTKQMDNTGFFKAEVEIDLRGRRILSGGIANVDIEIHTHEGIVVESQAVVDRLVEELPEHVKRDNPLVDRSKKSTTVVYRVIDGKAVVTPVRRGPSDDTHSVIFQGLNEGEVIVIGPFKSLEKLKHDEAVMDEATATPEATASEGKKSGISVRVG